MKKNKILFLILLICNQLFAQDIDNSKALELIKNNAKAFNIKAFDEQPPLVTNAYTDAQTGLTFIYFQQQFKGIKVFNQIQSATFKNDILQYKSGKFIENIASKVPSSIPQTTAIDAIKNAAKNLQILLSDNPIELDNQFAVTNKIVFNKANISKRNIKTELVWKVDYTDNSIHLAWAVSIAPVGTQDNWLVMVDALNGTILDKKNETIYEKNPEPSCNNFSVNKTVITQKNILSFNNKITPIPPPTTVSANYKVVPFPNESPFTNGISVETNPWLKAGAGNNAITNGWHFDGTTNYNITRGNNVFAYDDSLNQDAPGRWATSTSTLPNLNFSFTPDFNKQPTTTANRLFATTNLFYWNNLMHDVSYQYGFNEASGNFQADNLGRGGLGNDFVMAEAQDGGGTNNANFWANPDGDTARMQMYLFSASTNFKVLSPSAIAGSYTSKEGAFSINNLLANVGSKTGQIVLYNDDAAGTTHNACGAAANILTSKIALIQYAQLTGCTFRQRVKNAQNAGAIAVVVIYTTNNVITMGGSDNTITIPAVMIGKDDGDLILGQLALGNTVTVKLLDGIQFDGDIDNGVVCHEYTHGISIRLTGGAANSSCLDNAEQAGEGWSDYMALMMTTNWQTATINDGSILKQIGVYAFAQIPTGTGIRTYPYTTNMLVNPHTYSDMATVTGEAHYIGEIWCSTIWDMTWALIQQENSINPNLYNANGTGGNVVAMNLVMLGLKLQPCMPGFLDSRDAILAADDILYNGKHKCTIWNAFARRGMGYSAIQGSSSSTSDQVAAFDVPMSVKLSKPDAYKILQSTLSTGLNVKASCQCKSPTSHYKIKAIIPAGFSYVTSAGGVSNADSVIFANINFTKTFQTDSILLNIKATAAGCALDTVIYDNRDAKKIGGFTSNAISGTNNWVTTTQYAYSPTHSWQATDLQVQTEFTLTSNSFTPTNLSLLSFWHQYDLEGGYDGGVVETSINSSSTWQDAGANALQNGYNATMANTSPLTGLQAFSGTTTTFQNSIINLSKLSGKNVKLRFRVATDVGNGTNTDQKGWVVDDITVTNGCGSTVKFYVYDSANNLLDSASTPVYIIPKILPVKFSQFIAKAINKNSLLQWIVAEQVNVKKYIVERSGDANNWNEIGEVFAQLNNDLEYSFNDKKPFEGMNYYRIKAVDFNGSINLSSIQKVNYKDVFNNQILIIPNPSKTTSKIYLPQNFAATQIKIFDVQGRLVLNQTNNLNDTYINLNTSLLAEGTYIVNVLNRAGEVLTEKLVIVK